MSQAVDAFKARFREGHRDEAIAACEALCERDPGNREIKRLCATMHGLVHNYGRALELLHQIRDPGHEDADILFNIAVCERELKNFSGAERFFKLFTEKFPDSPDGWASLAECKFQLNEFDAGISLADRAIALHAASPSAWTVRGHCQKSLRKFADALASYDKANQIEPAGECHFNAALVLIELGKPLEAIDSFDRAIALAPNLVKLKLHRGDALHGLGRVKEAVADYKAALALAPADAEILKKATLCLLDSGRGDEALELCLDIIKGHPDNLTARLGAQWVLTQLVPIWHVPMMNELERNQAFHDGLATLVTPDKVVFEIGTGSGLLAMMAARLGARKVFTCEAVGLIADTARKIIEANHYQDRITVLAKPSHSVQLERDLPAKADILVHEIFSSELLGEHVLPAIEDAKERLLKPGGEVLPSAASIMFALVGGDELGKNLYVGDSFGFDLREFNAIHPKKRPLYREDLAPILMSDDIEAFRFDFSGQLRYPAEKKRVQVTARQGGLCYGVIQWIRLELSKGVLFENHPSRPRAVSNWQHTVHGFDKPIHLEEGSVVSVVAMHDRSRPWFELAPGDSRV